MMKKLVNKSAQLLLITCTLIALPSSKYGFADQQVIKKMAFPGLLRVSPSNSRYFSDGSGKSIYLTGSHTWLNFQDGGIYDPPAKFNYAKWLDFLRENRHNFFRMWVWEQTKWVVESSQEFYFTPHPFQRTGPGLALDGKPRFDLRRFDQSYFDRLRNRIVAAGRMGIYVSVMLFNGWSVSYPKKNYNLNNPWRGSPFNKHNNINGLDGDPDEDNSGVEVHTLQIPAITEIQKGYVRKIIDTVNDLDNVLYEISNESHSKSTRWQYHMIKYIKKYETRKSKKHPVGMTVPWPNGDNTALYKSPADWISLNGTLGILPSADGRKVIIADTDHICGICGNREWAWSSFTRGYNLLFMDQYDDGYRLGGGGYDLNNVNDVSLRRNLGYIRQFAEKIDLKKMSPRGDLSSSGYALASPVNHGSEYLVYMPEGGEVNVDLSAGKGILDVEWFNPDTGEITKGRSVKGGNPILFTAPFPGDAVLYIYGNKINAD